MLRMGGAETERSKILTYNPAVQAEVDDVRRMKDSYLARGFRIRSKEEGEIIMDPPLKGDHIGVMRILSQNGDDRVIWDRRDKGQVKEAMKKFLDFIKRGFTAYVVGGDGKKGHKIDTFDPGLEEILMAKGRELLMVPKTVPG